MATISGKWKFNDVVTLNGQAGYFDFSCNGIGCHGIYAGPGTMWFGSGMIEAYREGAGWLGNYKTIEIDGEQTVDDSFYEWLTANATKVLTIADKLAIITANEQKVYEAGLNKGGYAGGYADGYEQGKKAEYDAFWDAYQENGTKTNYSGAFYGQSWNDETFRPKYDIAPVRYGCSSVFFQSTITDLAAALDRQGVKLDFSKVQSLSSAFQASLITKIPPLDLSSAITCGNAFYNCSGLKSIALDNIKEACEFAKTFTNCRELIDVTLSGTVGQDIDFQYSTKLSADSIRSIITHLSDTAQGKTLTLSRTAVENAITSGGLGGDTVYMTTDGAFSEYLYSNPIPLSKGQTIKITFDMEEGHDFYSDGTTDWWFGSAGLTAAGGTPNHKSGWTWTATQDDEQVVLMWYFDSNVAVSNIPIKIRAVLVDEDGNELTGENLNSFAADTVPNNGITLTITDDSWETLQASKPNWTITLV